MYIFRAEIWYFRPRRCAAVFENARRRRRFTKCPAGAAHNFCLPDIILLHYKIECKTISLEINYDVYNTQFFRYEK